MRKPILCCLAALALTGVHAQAPDEKEAILDFRLTTESANHLIQAMEAMTKHVVSPPNFQEVVRKSMSMTPAERLAEMEKDPKAMAIVKANGLTAKEYLTGVQALRMALSAAQDTKADVISSPANIAFAKAHLAELKPKMDAADGVAARVRRK